MWLFVIFACIALSMGIRLHHRGQNRRWDLRHRKREDGEKSLTGFLDNVETDKYVPLAGPPPSPPPFLHQMRLLYERAPDAPGTRAFLKQRLNADDCESRLLAALCLGWETIDVVEWELTVDREFVTRDHMAMLWQRISCTHHPERREKWLMLLVSWLHGVSLYDPRIDLLRDLMAQLYRSLTPGKMTEKTSRRLEDALTRLLRYQGYLEPDPTDGSLIPSVYPNDCIRAPAARLLGIFGTHRSLRVLRRYAGSWETGKEGKAAARASIAKIEERAPCQGGELSISKQQRPCSKGGLSACRD